MKKNYRLHMIVHGEVQGVFYRAATKEKAEQLGLTGWVRNNEDETVEAVFEGPLNKLEELLQWCHVGPEYAQVDFIESDFQPYIGEFPSITVY